MRTENFSAFHGVDFLDEQAQWPDLLYTQQAQISKFMANSKLSSESMK